MHPKFSVLFLLVLFISSCASSYHPIEPTLLTYPKQVAEKQVMFSYKYNVLKEVGNKRYSKKESKKSIKVIALKITNNSTSNLIFGKNLFLFAEDQELKIISTDSVVRELKQPVFAYILYAALSPIKIPTTNGASVADFPIGYAIGPILALGNIAVAAGGNKKLKDELNLFQLENKEIKVGETVYGLIAIQHSGLPLLSLKIAPQ